MATYILNKNGIPIYGNLKVTFYSQLGVTLGYT